MKSNLRKIQAVATDMGLPEEAVEPYGWHKAKIDFSKLPGPTRKGKYVVVTAMTPTPFGEGKTTVAIGLSMALSQRLGYRAVVTLRQPSMGPTFGIKGGGAGGGRAQVVPMEEMNLHLTGDIHAVSAAHNLLAAVLDNHLHHGNALDIDPYSVQWPRVVDMNDRALRHIIVGLGGKENGPVRETGFIISVASEIMAILALSSDLQDLRRRLGRIVVASDRAGRWVNAEELRAAGAMAAILRDALKPNLMQSTEGTPVLVHTGPFANIAHGNSSILADRVALGLADFVVTEAGFGSDMGLEKFMNIKARYSGQFPDIAVLVATIRALKYHGLATVPKNTAELAQALAGQDPEALRRGTLNLARHIAMVKGFGLPCVVALNRHATDRDEELRQARDLALEAGADGVEVVDVFEMGSQGGVDLSRAVAKLASSPTRASLSYSDDLPLRSKIERVATSIYGASGVDFEPKVLAQLDSFEKAGFGGLPVCIAKTHLSISHDPALRGSPRGYRLPITDAKLYAGAGFVVALAGSVQLMPGLPSRPAAEAVDLDGEGNILGLF